MPVTIGVLKETVRGENRVAIVPEVATRLAALGARVLVEHGAGTAARFPDAQFKDASFADGADAVLAASDLLFTVQPPDPALVAKLKPGAAVAGFLAPHNQAPLVRALKERRITSFAMELVPRISRAQSMDALSSQAAVAGYKAVLIGSAAVDRFFPMLTTAAGTIRPATVLVIGAGVAGLQAIATAKRLGAVVEAYDVRGATREQVRSLGAKFVETGVTAEGAGGYARELTAEEKAKQQEVLDARIAAADCVISTAGVPGRPAPRIISRAAVERMKPGAVIVDLLAEGGGNCELTRAGETVEHNGVRVIGPVNLPATVAYHASDGTVRHEPTRKLLESA
jgi:NAD(P) transhydrogenase subunit alpha